MYLFERNRVLPYLNLYNDCSRNISYLARAEFSYAERRFRFDRMKISLSPLRTHRIYLYARRGRAYTYTFDAI